MSESSGQTHGPAPRARRGALVGFLVLALGALALLAWALWPAAGSWPSAFCAPVTRVVSSDVTWTMTTIPPSAQLAGPAETGARRTLMGDVARAENHAPTAQLSHELAAYLARLSRARHIGAVQDAVSRFDALARTQLQSCGIFPLGSGG